jgi:type IV secretion system protein VirD4
MRNYAGHRLAPWLAHVMVSRQETARQLLTPGEVMQLPPDDELVLVAGLSPIRAKKLRYYLDPNFAERVSRPPLPAAGRHADRPARRPDDWSDRVSTPLPPATPPVLQQTATADDGGRQQQLQLELPGHATVVAKEEVEPRPVREEEDVAVATRAMARAKGPSPAQQGFAFNRSVERNLVED